MDEEIGPERPVQIGVTINHQERDLACTSRMLDQHEELNCLPRPCWDIAHMHFNIYDLALPKAEAEVGCIQNTNWPYDFVPSPRYDGQAISAAKLRAKPICKCEFATIIT